MFRSISDFSRLVEMLRRVFVGFSGYACFLRLLALVLRDIRYPRAALHYVFRGGGGGGGYPYTISHVL